MVERAIAACNTRLSRHPLVFRLTALVARHYSFHMAESSKNSSLDVEFKRLEKRLEELVSTVHRLKDENRALRARQDTLAAEKTTVMNRSEQVRAQRTVLVLEAMHGGDQFFEAFFQALELELRAAAFFVVGHVKTIVPRHERGQSNCGRLML